MFVDGFGHPQGMFPWMISGTTRDVSVDDFGHHEGCFRGWFRAPGCFRGWFRAPTRDAPTLKKIKK